MKKILLIIAIVLLVVVFLYPMGNKMLTGRSSTFYGFNVLIEDSDTGDTAQLDNSTGSLMTIDYAHHENHSGSSYFLTNHINLTDDGASTSLAFTVPDTTAYPHVTYAFAAGKALSIVVYENISTTSNGTAVIAQNHNRTSLTDSNLMIAQDALASTTYITAYCTVAASTTPCIKENIAFGAAGKNPSVSGSGGAIGRAQERIWKPNTTYYFKIITGSDDDSVIAWNFDWYEHTDRN